MNHTLRHKLFVASLTLGLPFALVACNQSSPDTSSASPTSAPADASATDATATPTPTPLTVQMPSDTNAPAATTNAAPAQ